MTKRITICIDVSDENEAKLMRIVNSFYSRVDHELRPTLDPNFNWDVTTDDAKEDEVEETEERD